MIFCISASDSAASRPSFLAVDFFCGAGGTTRGLIDAGGYVIAGIDKDARCKRTFVENNANTAIDCCPPHFLERDIFPATGDYPEGQQDGLFADLEDLIPFYRFQAKGAPLLFAICAPCQPFTKLSKKELTEERKEGRKRDRNLLSEAAKFVKQFQPEFVLSENVAGIREHRYGGVWDEFRHTIAGKHQIRGSGQFARMEPVTKPGGKHPFAHGKFRFGVLILYRRHHGGALSGGNFVCHGKGIFTQVSP